MGEIQTDKQIKTNKQRVLAILLTLWVLATDRINQTSVGSESRPKHCSLVLFGYLMVKQQCSPF